MGLTLTHELTMKFKYSIIYGLAITAGLSSCKDEMVITPAVDEGTVVAFGVGINDNKTRTYYGEEFEQDGRHFFPIYWNTEAMGYDEIFIYTPNGFKGQNSAYYQVKPNSEDQAAGAQVAVVGTDAIKWGASDTSDFYGFYPGNKSFNLQASGTTITATLPGNQTCSFDEDLNPVDPGTPKKWQALADMNACMMFAKTEGVHRTDEVVNLEFNPLSSVLSITVNGPDETTTVNPQYITSVSVTANKQICGTFSYDYSTDQIIANSTDEADCNIEVQTMGLDKDKDLVGVPLSNGQTLNVRMFIIPQDAIELTVSVITSENYKYNKKLNTTNIKPRQINRVSLPLLNAEEADFNFATWMSQLDPRIYISELSLPGSALSFNTPGAWVDKGNNTSDDARTTASNQNNIITQNKTVAEQFNAGIRAFQGHIWLVDGNSPLGGTSTFHLVTSDGQDTGVSLVETLRSVRAEMEGAHTKGFCVVTLSDYTLNNDYTLEDVYTRLNVILEGMEDQGVLPSNEISQNTTLAEVRGKIIVDVQLNGGGNRPAWSGLNNANCIFNIWRSSVGSTPLYSPVTYGMPPTDKYTSTNGTTDIEGNAIDLKTGMWMIYGEQANAGANYNATFNNIGNVNKAITSTFNKDLHNIFYRVWCGGVGNRAYNVTGTGIIGTRPPFTATDSNTPGTYNASTIATNFATEWRNQTLTKDANGLPTATADFKEKPFGWVYFNFVASNSTVQENIKDIIRHNATYKLNRNRNQTPANAPNGDTKGVTNGGKLF